MHSDMLAPMDVLTDIVRCTEASGVVLARTRFSEPWGFSVERTQEAGFHLVLDGSGWLEQEGQPPLRLSAGDLVLLPHGDPHRVVSSPGGAAPELCAQMLEAAERPPPPAEQPGATLLCGAYRFEQHPPHPLMRTLPTRVHVPAAKARAHPALSSTLSLIAAELDRAAPGSELVVERLIDVLFLFVMRTLSEEDGAAAGCVTALADPALSPVLSRMHEEPARRWTVEALASEARMSRASFARRFSSTVGEPPLEYLTRWRMSLAARHLKHSEASLAEIAARVGYESEFSFSRAFKRAVGQPPAAFRRAHRAG